MGSSVHTPGGYLRATVRAAATGGALMLAVLFLLDFLGLRLDFMGVSDDRAISRILHEYGGDVIRGQLELLAVMALAGSVFGAAGGFILHLRSVARSSTSWPSRRRGFFTGAAAALAGHSLVFARHLVLYPQLYSEAFYDRGGLRRSFMLALTRHFSPQSFFVIGAVVVVALLPMRFVVTHIISLVRRAAAKRRTLVVVAVFASLLALRLSLRPSGVPDSLLIKPNVLLIAVDSLRADRVFGAGNARFPTIASLAQRSVRFRQDHVTVPRTFPSFVTLLTGRYPHHHGIRHMFPSAETRSHIGTSLPQALAKEGYRTAVVSDYAGEIFARTPIGFQTIDVPQFDMHTIVALRGLQLHPNAMPYAAGIAEALFPFVRAMPERANPRLLADRAIKRLGELETSAAHNQPFFLTLFFSTPHFPYAAPYPYYERYVDPLYAGPFLYDKPPLAVAPVTPVDAKHIQALYDGAVSAVDDSLKRVLDELDRAGIADDTIVVLLSDHGENLWEDERSGMGHGDHLIGDRADHVPLLVLDPRKARPHDVGAIVRDVDVATTLAARLGVHGLATDGVDLGPLLRGEKDDLGLAAFSETEYWFTQTGPGFAANERLPYPAVTGATDLAADGDVFLRPEMEPLVIAAKHRSVRFGDWKLRYRPTRTGVELALFDLAHDPEERHDVAATQPERLRLLREKLYGWMLSDPNAVLRGDFVVPK